MKFDRCEANKSTSFSVSFFFFFFFLLSGCMGYQRTVDPRPAHASDFELVL